jgi:hypothetical protein
MRGSTIWRTRCKNEGRTRFRKKDKYTEQMCHVYYFPKYLTIYHLLDTVGGTVCYTYEICFSAIGYAVYVFTQVSLVYCAVTSEPKVIVFLWELKPATAWDQSR